MLTMEPQQRYVYVETCTIDPKNIRNGSNQRFVNIAVEGSYHKKAQVVAGDLIEFDTEPKNCCAWSFDMNVIILNISLPQVAQRVFNLQEENPISFSQIIDQKNPTANTIETLLQTVYNSKVENAKPRDAFVEAIVIAIKENRSEPIYPSALIDNLSNFYHDFMRDRSFCQMLQQKLARKISSKNITVNMTNDAAKRAELNVPQDNCLFIVTIANQSIFLDFGHHPTKPIYIYC